MNMFIVHWYTCEHCNGRFDKAFATVSVGYLFLTVACMPGLEPLAELRREPQLPFFTLWCHVCSVHCWIFRWWQNLSDSYATVYRTATGVWLYTKTKCWFFCFFLEFIGHPVMSYISIYYKPIFSQRGKYSYEVCFPFSPLKWQV